MSIIKNIFKKKQFSAPPVIVNRDFEIRAENLTYTYDRALKTRFTAVRNFSHTFYKNKIYCIIGSSGSGKSTLIQHFNGLLKADSGHVWVKDRYIDPTKKKIKKIKQIRRNVSVVFQFPEYQLFKETIEKDIMFGPIALGIEKAVAKQRAKKYLNQLGLDDEFLSRSPFELSGGQKRRVAIAGILAIETDIVIFDEPTAGLDPAGESEMMDIIKDLRADGKTVIVVTHNMDHVLEISDEVIVLKDGQKLASGTPFEIFKNDNLIRTAVLEKPLIYKTIDSLVQTDEKMKVLYSKEIRTVEDLATKISKIIK